MDEQTIAVGVEWSLDVLKAAMQQRRLVPAVLIAMPVDDQGEAAVMPCGPNVSREAVISLLERTLADLRGPTADPPSKDQDRRLVLVVERMRAQQKLYFKTRNVQALEEARRLELEIDEMLKARRAGPGLFDEQQHQEGHQES